MIYLMNNFHAEVLIKTNIITKEEISLNLDQKKLIIDKVKINIV